jgi:hypothetical protein
MPVANKATGYKHIARLFLSTSDVLVLLENYSEAPALDLMSHTHQPI